MQHFLKSASASAWAQIVAAELFQKLDLTAFDRAVTAFDARFGRESLTPLRGTLESKEGQICRDAFS